MTRSPKEAIHGDFTEQEIFAPNLQVRAVSHTFQCTHGLGFQGESLLNVIVIGQTEGNVGAEIFEVSARGDTAVLGIN